MSEQQIILYNFWRSSASWRVRAALAFKKLEYKYVPVHLGKGQQKDEEYSKLNSMNVVPTLVIDGHTLVQSLSILEYLEDTRPDVSPLLPKDPFKRAVVRQIMQIIGSDIQPLQTIKVTNKILELTNNDQNKKSDWVKTWISNGFNGLEKLLQQHSGKYAVGDQVTLADLCIPAQVFSANAFNLDLTPYPNIDRINQNLLQLPEFQSSSPQNQIDADK
ncbi:maleylacetoacetate isomerase [Cavenderia fasciculata]|uniref:Maleylacetoacetate isomerase n=1 Tax=Cavenderia fasciculata TaxID=261658 RepID=F4PJB9_CACFS|nr:maleylacetoacetate isomerase [Cavenderia fasciculata]EGG24405.1 maleylacetoacetate isomerase [Cavenderia fasciculata]|eukprot:XP_004362256.1 maleylacetoacetate isomerase [Cavenderia fasciculata]